MARAGQEIFNALTGERIRFLQTAAETDGRFLQFESRWEPGDRVVAHIHPKMEERWEVLEGEGSFSIAGQETVVGPGGSIVAAAGTSHRAWNAGPGVARVLVTFTPALRWEDFMERLFALQSRGGSPQELAALAAEFPDEVAPARGSSAPLSRLDAGDRG